MSEIFNVASITEDDGTVSTVNVTQEMKSEKYIFSFECTDLGERAFFCIYALLSDATWRTYWVPVQFLGVTKVNIPIDANATYLELYVKRKGATISNVTLNTKDTPYLEYVKTQTGYWDRIKEVTNSVGKLRAEAMEGIINLALNAFANNSGTITQEDGVMTFLNGTSPQNSTMAVQIVGGAIRIANSKLANGEWNWTTALTGAGINADTITAGTLRAIDISGVNIIGTQQMATNIEGVNIKGSVITADNGTSKLEIKEGFNPFTLYHNGYEIVKIVDDAGSGRFYLMNEDGSALNIQYSDAEGWIISTGRSTHGGTQRPIVLNAGVTVKGNLNVQGSINATGTVYGTNINS